MKHRQVIYYWTGEAKPRMMVEFVWFLNGRKLPAAYKMQADKDIAEGFMHIDNWMRYAITPDGRTVKDAL